ncbi:SgcJ/EcaC family oxidoreductase [Niabella beijingensis]|uniref:SgcJ/EcaC family oxidoreductase n=1 Tax=Niabella beijingensis TaxID=2872700 RepID=UPI001CC14EF0|nr:SgcJ/EcaC family oxidoreductase [Niabella beijingensis]MBZ4187255.1 SgcJ/EcaC family oxidoreductase [Niabella beijingensis]
MTDEQIIRTKLEKIKGMFQHPTLGLFEDLFTEDCDYITFNGQHLKGIEENFDAHVHLSNLKLFRGAVLESDLLQIKFVNPDTAIVIATGGIRFRWQKQLPQSRRSINTNVFIRQQNGDWKIASFQNSRIRKPGWLQRLLSK